MEEALPEWLDKTFLEAALQGEQNKELQVTVLAFTAEPAVGAGNNYTTDVYRVHVQYKVGKLSDLKTIALIVKSPIENGFWLGVTKKIDFFSKEPIFYAKLLEKINEKLKCEFAPKSLYCPIRNGLVLKDLKAEGYVLLDKLKLLDFSYCQKVFETLAKYHASSVAVYNENPDLIRVVAEEYMFRCTDPAEPIKALQKVSFRSFVHTLNSLGYQTTANVISKREKTMWKSVANICKPKENGLNVLNHGDCWINNIMFKQKDFREVIDIKFIDFQTMRFSSPVLDLLFFLITSASDDVRDNHQEELYDIYLKTINKTLEDLGCKERLTLEEFQEDLNSISDYLLLLMSYYLPFMRSESEKAIDLGDIKPEDYESGRFQKKFNKMASSKPYRESLPALIRQFESWCFSPRSL